VCPDFVGPGRFVGQLQAVVLRFWDTPEHPLTFWNIEISIEVEVRFPLSGLDERGGEMGVRGVGSPFLDGMRPGGSVIGPLRGSLLTDPFLP